MSNVFNKIFDESVAVLSQSKAIKDWITANPPATTLFIHDGVLDEDLPTPDSYPIVAFSAVEQVQRGDDVRDNEFLLSVGCAIFNTTQFSGSFYEEIGIIGSATTPDTIVRKLPGKISANDFWLIVSKEILSIKGLYCKINTEGQSLFEEVYPIFKVSGTFRFTFKKELRSSRL